MNRDWQRGLTVVLERHALFKFIQIHRKATQRLCLQASVRPCIILSNKVQYLTEILNTVVSLKATLFSGVDCLVIIGWRLRSNRHQETSFTSVCNVSATTPSTAGDQVVHIEASEARSATEYHRQC